MQKICTYCQYIGKGKTQEECSWGTTIFFLAATIVTIIISLYFPLVLVITFVMIALTLTGAVQCLADCSLCPKCDKYFMIAIDSDEAKEYISDNKIDTPNLNQSHASLIDKLNQFSYETPKLCTECLYIGPSVESKHTHGITKGFLWISTGIFSLFLGFIYPLSIIGSYILCLAGFAFIANSLRDNSKCPKCMKKTMINLDSKIGQAIIDNKRLPVPLVLQPKLPIANRFIVSTIWGIIMTIIAIIYYYLYQYFVRIHG